MQTRFEDVAGPIALPGTFPIEQSDLRSRVLLWTAPVITLLAEIVYTRFDPLIGIGLYTLAILALLIQLGLTLYPSQAHGNASMTLMAFAVIRITTLTLQHLQIRREYQLGLIALGALVTVAITTRNTHFDPQPGALTSLTASALLQVTAVLAGVALGTVFYALTDAHLVPKLVVLPITVDITALGIGILAVTLFGFIEEIVFRHLLQRTTSMVFGISGVLIIAALQAALMVGYLSPGPVLFALLISMLFSLLSRACGTVLGVALGRSFANLVVFVLGPLFGSAPLLPVAVVCSGLALLLSVVAMAFAGRALFISAEALP